MYLLIDTWTHSVKRSLFGRFFNPGLQQVEGESCHSNLCLGDIHKAPWVKITKFCPPPPPPCSLLFTFGPIPDM